MQSPKEEVETRVLIEWKEYDTHYLGTGGNEPVVRVEALAELLHSAKNSCRFRALHCAGYFHDLLRHSFGLIHNYIRICLVLNDRFKLAYQLCVALLDFHKIGWLHKNLIAQSIYPFRILSAVLDQSTSPTLSDLTTAGLMKHRHSLKDQIRILPSLIINTMSILAVEDASVPNMIITVSASFSWKLEYGCP